MRPYLAVLKDALREALASRILWLLTGLITLLLGVGLAPFSLREESASRFQRNEFRNGPAFLKLLASQETAARTSPGRRIWIQFSEALKKRLREIKPDNVDEQINILSSVRDELNGMLDRDDLFDKATWSPEKFSDELKQLFERGIDRLGAEDRRRFNRLLIDAAFPDHVIPAPGKVLFASWFGYRLGGALPFEPKQLVWLVNASLVALTTFLAGVLGVFIAILVTASIVPQTFEPGAIDLLLSKPVSRPLLFLTKFFGACAFILLNSAYLIGGMWLIVGLRFDIWSTRLLFCIPVFLFLFVIYYSVSALVGVVWKNAIVSVCCTILFWGLCFAVGTAKNVVESTFLNPTRLAAIIPAGDRLLALNKSGQTFEWSGEKRTWEEVFRSASGGGPQFLFRNATIGPAYDPKSDTIFAIESTPTRFEMFAGAGKLLIGPHKEDWRRIQSAATPAGGQSIFVDPAGRLVVVSLSGVYRFEGDLAAEHRPFKIFGFDIAPRDRDAKFVPIGPEPRPQWQRPFSAAMNPVDGSIAVVEHGRLILLTQDAAGNYVAKKNREFKGDQGTAVAFAGSRVAVVSGDGSVRIFSTDDLAELISLQPRGRQKPRSVVGSPDGRWLAVLFHDRYLWLCDPSTLDAYPGNIVGQGDVSAVTFSQDNRLYASDRFGRVTVYESESFRRAESFEPPAETLELFYRYLITPLYTVFPKPGELDNLVAYLLTEEQTDPFDRRRDGAEDLSRERVVLDIWRPIWSNLAFLAVTLTLTCVYISRRDF